MGKGRVQTSPFKNDAVKGKVAVITGGGSGIGFEIARQLGGHGAKVVLMGRREEPLKLAVEALSKEGIVAAAVSGDVRDPEACAKVIDTAVRTFGKLDILVNNAAGNFLSAAEDLSPRAFKTVMEIDTMGVFNMCHAAFPHLKKSGDALICNISITFHYRAQWYQIHPSAAKAAIDSMTRNLALEWGEYGIRTVGVAPGPIGDTAGWTKLSGVDNVEDSEDEVAKAIVPVGRLGSKFDIAMAVLFMATAAGDYINGHTIVVDGGNWLMSHATIDRDTVRSFSRKVEGKSRETGIAKAKL